MSNGMNSMSSAADVKYSGYGNKSKTSGVSNTSYKGYGQDKTEKSSSAYD